VLSLRRRLALVRVRSLTAFARVVIRGTVLASLRSLAAAPRGGVRFASLARRRHRRKVGLTVRFEKAVYVLHAFQKKSPSGIRTAKRDVDLVEQRLKQAQRDYEEHYGKTTR